MMKAKVYKRHGVTQLSSSAGHVSNCDYGSGQCELYSGARILWNVDAEGNGLFMPYRNLSGKLSVEENKYLWIVNDIQLILSFPRHLGCLLSENCAEMACLLMNKVWLPKGRPAQLYPLRPDPNIFSCAIY